MATAVINPTVTSLWTAMKDQFKYLLEIDDNMSKLKKVSEELQDIRDEVEDKIKRAIEIADDEEPTKQVVKWLEKVQTMENDVNKIEHDHMKLQKMCLCLGDFPLNCWSGYKISKRAANTAEEVEELIKEKDKMDVLTIKVVPPVQPKPDNSELLSTTQVYLEDAIKHLQDDMTSMVGIWGMGGVGKTTLLTKINNHPNAGGFLVIWVVVSQELNLHKLQRDIAKRINLEPEGDSTVESQAASLSHFLQNKKILLLLDDLWESFDLEKLGIPCRVVNKDSVPNCKVVFTTRSEMVCDRMMAMHKLHAHVGQKKIKLECLMGEEAWQLFRNNIGETARNIVSSDDRVYNYAKKVAEKCSGLPLTIVLIAQSMSSNTTLYEWEDAVNSINKLGIQKLLGEESVFRLLKVSYDRLEDERLRKCFLTCALWPEDYRIEKDVLIWSWLGLDLIAGREFDDINEAFTRGHTIIKRLERAGLLLEAGEEFDFGRPFSPIVQYVKLHDIIREMALWIATDYGINRNKWLVQVGVHNKAITEAAEEEQKLSEVEMAFTVVYDYRNTLRVPHKPCCPNLTALMLRGRLLGFFQNMRLLDSFFQNMVALTYLDLANSDLSKVPSEITTLSQLQYLNLAGNRFDQLPKELSNLKKLKYLILGGITNLQHIPRGLLSGLEKLEVLDLFGSDYTKWGKEGEASIEELAGARGTMAPGVNNLKGLGIDVDNMSALQLLTQINPHITLWKLCILLFQGVEILDLSKTLLRSNRALRSLQSLSIELGHMKEILMTSEEKRQFEKLSLFSLRDLYELTKITWKGGITPGELFANISEVKTMGCDKLCDVTWIAQLRHLEILEITNCNMLEKVLTDGANQEKDQDDDDDVGVEQEERRATTMILPNLRHLTLHNLPNLKSFCSPEIRRATTMILPNLSHLFLKNLPDLKSFCSPEIRFPKLKRNCVRIELCPQLDQTPFM